MRTLTMGTFDMIHPGHLDLLTKCREMAGGDELTVAVNSDEFVAKFKRKPVLGTEDRLSMIAALSIVDAAILNDGTNQLALIASTNCKLIVIGSDWAPPKDYLKQIGVTQEQLDNLGISVCYAARPTNWWSTSRIRDLVLHAEGPMRASSDSVTASSTGS